MVYLLPVLYLKYVTGKACLMGGKYYAENKQEGKPGLRFHPRGGFVRK